MKLIYSSAYLLGVVFLVPVIFRYFTAKSKEDDIAVYTVILKKIFYTCNIFSFLIVFKVER